MIEFLEEGRFVKLVHGHGREVGRFKNKHISESSQCFDMKLWIYLYCDIFYHVRSIICSLRPYFDHFWGAKFVSRNTKVRHGLRRPTYFFRVQLSLYLINCWNDFGMFIFNNVFSLQIHQLLLKNRPTWPLKDMF